MGGGAGGGGEGWGVGGAGGGGRAGGWGGWHCIFEGRYPLPKYSPCFSGLSASKFSLTAPYFLEVADHGPLK